MSLHERNQALLTQLGSLLEGLDPLREIPRRLADEALAVATTDPHDPAWDLYFHLRSLEGAA